MIRRKEEANVTCSECGREVPATLYCIYCGSKLPKPAPSTMPPTPPPAPPPEPAVSPPPTPAEVKEDIRELMTNISLHYSRKIALLNLLQSKEISERVFLRLYDEYTDKLHDSLSTRASVLERLKSELNEKETRYDGMKILLEELEVRHKIGEIALQEFTEKSERLKSEVKNLEKAIKELRGNLNHLEKMLADKTPSEILDLETRTKACYQGFEKLLKEGALTMDTLKKIKPDVESMLELLNSLIINRKERQETLQKELETLEARYRVGEVSIEYYEKRRRELRGELEKVWI